ncbi:MAG: N-acetylmuramoyl-L-alanine amidase [Oscillospiraceae bacterium]|jgi:LysM repeat protein|nr:N-acetylmuramoyl-L-alanine amidase [Oscillospiraceae bacterium]
MAEQVIKIAVFAGHGGSDPGAVSGKLLEKDYTLKTANALAKRLSTLGYTVLQNRTTDVDSGISAKCTQANNAGVSAVCELHLNAGGGTGSEVWYADGSTQGKAFAEKVLTPLAALGYKNRGVKNDKTSIFGSFGILRGTKAPAVLAELCFLDNAGDMARFDADKAAAAVAEGICAFIKPPSTPSEPSVPSTPGAPLSVGDKVTVTGAYAASAGDKSAAHTAAIGRTLLIGKIYAGQNYPYRLDSGSTAIGFAKATSVKKIADSQAPQERKYTVVSGDGLWGIAEKLLGSGARYTEILVLNGLKSSLIKPGQVLKIPA